MTFVEMGTTRETVVVGERELHRTEADLPQRHGLANGYPATGGTGTHPNIAGMNFYVPVLTAALTTP